MRSISAMSMAAVVLAGSLVLPELVVSGAADTGTGQALEAEADGVAAGWDVTSAAEKATSGIEKATAGIEEIMESLAWEPGCADVVRAALEHSGSPGGKLPTTKRLRLVGLLPTLRFTVERSIEYDESMDQDGAGDVELGVDTDDDLEIRASLQWDLGSLAFSPAESGMISRKLQLARWRAEIAKEIVRLWHERRKLQVILQMWACGGGEADGSKELPATWMRVLEVTALIDAWTGGWYSRELERRDPKSLGWEGCSGQVPEAK